MFRHRLTGIAATVTVVALASSGAAAAETWTIPGNATITIKGHGYGHGHGLSQYGAEGAARKGLGYRQIVNYYYPGTKWGRATGNVKVLISADTTRDVMVGPRDGLTVRATTSGKSWNLAKAKAAAKRWRIVPSTAGRSEIEFKTSAWHRWRVLVGGAEFSAGGQPIRLYTPSGSVQYRGILRSTHSDTVNILPLDAYLKGVVPSEVIASVWHQQALRAQAIAARTYAAYERREPLASHYQICDTERCQVYGGYSAEYPTSTTAVDATAHQILTKSGKPVFAQFSASSGGYTSAGAFSYLPAKKDGYDGWSGNPYHSWSVTLADEDIESEWPEVGNLRSIRVSNRDGHGEWGGRVGTVTLTGSGGSVTVSGDDFRFLLDLYSTWFTLRVS
ncbi:SpoIID/LytB domain-containing protein [Nocardioides sp.]|uniref:SpoIID/LytB domain-containing protein n=1 Tax=Nocardioides sp. TaxID=35761 RepID=UPI0031FE71B1|nr:SpoIID/LytB domain protein [Nocardioides sp.]